MKSFSFSGLFIVIGCVTLGLNLVILDIFFIRGFFADKNGEKTSEIPSFTSLTGIQNTVSQTDTIHASSCPVGCMIEIREATASLKATFPTAVPTPKVTSKPAASTTSITTVKEYYVPFGGGSNQTDDWADVTGIQTYIDSVAYGRIKEVRFEASVYIPTGNEKVYVRLFNVTDKHPVWFSEISHEGGEAKLLISDPITLDKGNKLYQVQMKTTLKFLANLNQSRVHITTY